MAETPQICWMTAGMARYSLVRLVIWKWGRQKLPWREPCILGSSGVLRRDSGRKSFLSLPWEESPPPQGTSTESSNLLTSMRTLGGIECAFCQSWFGVRWVQMYLPRGKQATAFRSQQILVSSREQSNLLVGTSGKWIGLEITTEAKEARLGTQSIL